MASFNNKKGQELCSSLYEYRDMPALIAAAYYRRTEIVNLLIKAGADLNLSTHAL